MSDAGARNNALVKGDRGRWRLKEDMNDRCMGMYDA